MSKHYETIDERTRIFQKINSARLPLEKMPAVKNNSTKTSPFISSSSDKY